MFAWIKTIVLLPFNALVVAPALILYFADYHFHWNRPPLLAFGGLLLTTGLGVAAWTMWLFDRVGHGTAAPWQPPQRLVVRGPYRHVRNPMIVSVLTMLLAEALLLDAWVLTVWLAVFWAANGVYFPLFEEPALRRRFGADYEVYQRHVPRWLPRITPWRGDCFKC
jgi:protein-S-isoprenylcysteine O-methyltransferase Ste14